jgi:hypothetical protein
MKLEERIERKIWKAMEGMPLLAEASAIGSVAKSMKGQGSLEYIMMLAAASIVVVIALAMIVKIKGSVSSSVVVNGANMSTAQAISQQLSSLSSNVV